ncbi:MAG: copper chaperone, partial [Rhodospirillales bacterium]
MARGPVERLVLRDRWIVAGSMAVIVALAALYTYAGVGMSMSALDMTQMAGSIGEPMKMGAGTVWGAGYWILNFLMWWVMMIAMMTPSAAPTLLLYTAIKRVGADQDKAIR